MQRRVSQVLQLVARQVECIGNSDQLEVCVLLREPKQLDEMFVRQSVDFIENNQPAMNFVSFVNLNTPHSHGFAAAHLVDQSTDAITAVGHAVEPRGAHAACHQPHRRRLATARRA